MDEKENTMARGMETASIPQSNPAATRVLEMVTRYVQKFGSARLEIYRLPGASNEELTKDHPRSFIEMDTAPQAQPPSSNSNVKLASEKQVRCLKAIIREQQLSESEICQENDVDSLEDLPGKTCWKLINDLKKA